MTGNGTVEIAAAGMSFDKVTMADGAKFTVADGIDGADRWVGVLTVREDDDSIAFDMDPSKFRKKLGEDGRTTYFVRREKGMMLIFR